MGSNRDVGAAPESGPDERDHAPDVVESVVEGEAEQPTEGADAERPQHRGPLRLWRRRTTATEPHGPPLERASASGSAPRPSRRPGDDEASDPTPENAADEAKRRAAASSGEFAHRLGSYLTKTVQQPDELGEAVPGENRAAGAPAENPGDAPGPVTPTHELEHRLEEPEPLGAESTPIPVRQGEEASVAREGIAEVDPPRDRAHESRDRNAEHRAEGDEELEQPGERALGAAGEAGDGGHDRRLAELRKAYEQALARIESVSLRFGASEALTAELRETVAAERGRSEQLMRDLAARDATVTALVRELEQERLEGELARQQRSEVEEGSGARGHGEAESRIQQLTAELERQAGEHAELRAELDALGAAATVADEMSAQLRLIRAELAAAGEREQRLVEELAQRDAALAAVERERDRLRDAVTALRAESERQLDELGAQLGSRPRRG